MTWRTKEEREMGLCGDEGDFYSKWAMCLSMHEDYLTRCNLFKWLQLNPATIYIGGKSITLTAEQAELVHYLTVPELSSEPEKRMAAEEYYDQQRRDSEQVVKSAIATAL